MTDLFKLILGVLASLFRSRAKLEAEILVLRQQINVSPARCSCRVVRQIRDARHAPAREVETPAPKAVASRRPTSWPQIAIAALEWDFR
jgi:hypothetical protein